MIPIPPHLAKYDWYAPHVAWLKARGYATTHEPGEAAECHANLCHADLRDADLCHANLCVANLRGANLRHAYLRGANLRDAKNLPPAPVVPNIDKAILADIRACATVATDASGVMTRANEQLGRLDA